MWRHSGPQQLQVSHPKRKRVLPVVLPSLETDSPVAHRSRAHPQTAHQVGTAELCLAQAGIHSHPGSPVKVPQSESQGWAISQRQSRLPDPKEAPQASLCQAAHFVLPRSWLGSCPPSLVLPCFRMWGKCPRITPLPGCLHSSVFSQQAAATPQLRGIPSPAAGHLTPLPPQARWSFHHGDPPAASCQHSVWTAWASRSHRSELESLLCHRLR